MYKVEFLELINIFAYVTVYQYYPFTKENKDSYIF